MGINPHKVIEETYPGSASTVLETVLGGGGGAGSVEEAQELGWAPVML